ECGTEVWFDRTHNIVWDTLLSIGILGFLTYLGLFFALFFILAKKYFKEKTINFATFSVFLAIPIAYFVQNLMVFDMATSLIMFFLILGFGSFLANKDKEEKKEKFIFSSQWKLKGFLLLIFFFCFLKFIISPIKTDALVIKSIQAQTLPERLNLYQETLKTSPIGKYQIREFFAQQSQDIIIEKIRAIQKDEFKFKKDVLKEEVVKELDFSIGELEKTEKESPLNFKSILQLAQLYNIYSFIDPSKILLADEYGKKAMTLSPTNQYSYWTLARTKSIQGDFENALNLATKAIDLEPRHLPSYEIAIQFAQISGNLEKAKEIAKRAVSVNPAWQEKFKDLLMEN
ncbi:hypothetical protein KKA09_01915, partial [Patescibacteria group bacterium]|nr:hypothetical protein [Patescibacteria group bacterium]